jgi:glycosyltransferase involved in cell wall biosynthesis
LQTSLSVLVPVYNEQHLVAESLRRLTILDHTRDLARVEVIVVDDCSTDGTPQALATFQREQAHAGASQISWRFLRHDRNLGKGSAIRTALTMATGDLTVIHDADLEYHPRDLLRIVRVFIDEEADAVYGSRFAGGNVRRVLMYRHQLGNKLLTAICNLATNLNLTDIETCYKMVRTSLLKSIPLVSNDFCIEPELTIKLAKRRARIFEVPISYSGRTYEEGKKIGWKDGVKTLYAMLRFAVSDKIYVADSSGSHTLARLSRAPAFNSWMADTIRPYCGDRILEIGSGVGNMTNRLIPRRQFVASDVNPLYLQTLSSLAHSRPYLTVAYCDVEDATSFPRIAEGYDTVVCMNVIEHTRNDRQALENIRSVLVAAGRAVILVPNGQWNFGILDHVLGHYRRYSQSGLAEVARAAGFKVERILAFNRIGTVAWFLNGKVLRRRTFGFLQIKVLDVLMPLIRRVDNLLPLPPLSLIAILSPDSAEVAPRGPLDSRRDEHVLPTGASADSRSPSDSVVARSHVSAAAVLWLVALLATSTVSETIGWKHMATIQGSHPICGSLPDFGRLKFNFLPQEHIAALALNVKAPVPQEPLFCAQYQLAPLVVMHVNATESELWSSLQRGPLILDAPETRALEPALQAIAAQRALALERAEFPGGLLLLRLRHH